MSRIEFEEENFPAANRPAGTGSGPAAWLVHSGIVETKPHALKLLAWVAIAAVVLSFFLFKSVANDDIDERYIFDPATAEPDATR